MGTNRKFKQPDPDEPLSCIVGCPATAGVIGVTALLVVLAAARLVRRR